MEQTVRSSSEASEHLEAHSPWGPACQALNSPLHIILAPKRITNLTLKIACLASGLKQCLSSKHKGKRSKGRKERGKKEKSFWRMKRRAEIWKGLNKGYRKRTKYNKRIKDIEKEDKKLSLITQLCLTLCNPWTVAYQAPLSMGILWARILEWVAMPSSRGSSRARDWTQVSRIAGGFITIWATREAL